MASGATPIYSLPYPVLSDPVLIVEDLQALATAVETNLLLKVTNPMTTVGDTILGGAAGIPTRLPIGPNGYTLSSNGTTASWNPSIQGTTGMQGTQGIQGIQGIQGPQGTQGIEGLQGIQGTQGIQGVQGTQGVQGDLGIQGIQGTQGLQGIQGTQGLQGLQGGGFDQLQGTTGATGLQGITGTQGTQGIQGDLGIQGTQGTSGIQGILGTQGTIGVQGIQGVQGVQGLQGLVYTVENVQTGTTYTPVLGDAFKMITLSNAAAIAVSIPTDADVAYPDFTELHFEWEGVGQPTISAATPGTTTILSNGTTAAQPKLRARYSAATAWKKGPNDWRVWGDIS